MKRLNDFAKWLKKYMEDNNITQYWFIKRGVSQSTINGILSGKSPTERTIKKIYKALEINPPNTMENKKEAAELLPSLVFDEAEKMDMNDDERNAYEMLKSLPKEKRDQIVLNKFNDLPDEHQKAIMTLINLFLDSRR